MTRGAWTSAARCLTPSRRLPGTATSSIQRAGCCDKGGALLAAAQARRSSASSTTADGFNIVESRKRLGYRAVLLRAS